jgi:hypothetical protein
MDKQNLTPENNKNRNIIIGIVATALIAIASYFLFFNQKEKELPIAKATTDSLKANTVKSSATKDTIKDEVPYFDGEDDNETFSENYVIAKDAFLRNVPTANDASKVKQLKFGDKLFVKNNSQESAFYTVYLTKPANENKPIETPYYVTKSVLVSESEFNEYKKYFSLSPFSELASKTKKLILDEDYSNGTQYNVTQNTERAKSVLAIGDYDRDGIADVAIVLDNNEKQTSRLLIICTNNVTNEPYLAFAENYSDKVKINIFKKGASVIMNSDALSAAPNDGVMIKGEDIKLAVIYDNSLQKFKTYYQE